MPVLDIALYILAAILVLAGLAGAILPALPGVPLIYGGLWLAAWLNDFQHVGFWWLSIIAVIGIIAMALDFIASAIGAKRVGASSAAVWGALLGSIIGIFFGLPGLILGPFIGALLGEIFSGSSVLRSTRVGIGTWIGLLLGTLAKLVLSLMMIGVFAFAMLF